MRVRTHSAFWLAWPLQLSVTSERLRHLPIGEHADPLDGPTTLLRAHKSRDDQDVAAADVAVQNVGDRAGLPVRCYVIRQTHSSTNTTRILTDYTILDDRNKLPPILELRQGQSHLFDNEAVVSMKAQWTVGTEVRGTANQGL